MRNQTVCTKMLEKQKVEHLEPDSRAKEDHAMKSIWRLCGDVRKRFDKIMQETNAHDALNRAAKYLVARPVLLVGCFAVAAALALPLLLFTLFAITTIGFTFTGFVIVEGTLLVFGTVILCGVLLSIITSVLMMGLCLTLTYFICLHVFATIKYLKLP